MNKTIVINSSSISSVVGKNPFNNRSSVFLKLFKQNNEIPKTNDYTPCTSFHKKSPAVLGTLNEKNILKLWSQISNKEIKSNLKITKKKLFDLKNTWYLSGIPDGIIEEDNSLLEIKYRTRYFNDTIPIYDYIQIQSYMQLLDFPSCHYVQSYNGELKCEIFKKNDAFWFTEIIPQIIEFSQIYESLCENNSEMKKFLYFSSI